MFAKLLLLVVALASAQSAYQSALNNTLSGLEGFLYGLERTDKGESSCLQAFNSTETLVEETISNVMGCISLNFDQCGQLFTIFDSAIIHLQDIEIDCKTGELIDKIKGLASPTGVSDLLVSFFVNQKTINNLVAQLPQLRDDENWEQIGFNLGNLFKLIFNFKLD
jgi:hypothetical protein